MIRVAETAALMTGIWPRNAIRPNFARVAATVSGFRYDEILFDYRDRPRCRARHAGMWAARQYGLSYPMIGKQFSRDHTTCMLGVRRARQHRWDCDDFKAMSDEMLRLVREATR